ncbi:hypothetical protein SAMN02745673_02699 [Marinactinospora thermotolerans DSM 45154]|uniref:Uncharacterized protein n=1 Tax=Marinactinospora thermotolerans DSM 45154 TaxID=1122192 RepID=A0A1T4RCD6_9ACTN|nr:hypothetical protein SAMN02745673_02699 [Marinactinospora thermotolerans DSM 45154]
MARKVSEASLTTRPAPTRRRRRATVNRACATVTSSLPRPRSMEETVTEPARPALVWVLVPDATGRMRPEARWA